MFEYIKSKPTIYSLISDIIVLTGILYFHWSCYRIIAFFFADVELMILFFFIFMVWTKEITDVFSFVFGMMILSALLFFYFGMIENMFSTLLLKTSFEPSYSNLMNLFFPYYDTILFILFSSMSHFHTIKRLRKVPERYDSKIFMMKFIAYRMLMIPLIPIVFVLVFVLLLPFHMNEILLPLISLIIVKDILEYWKFKALKKLQIKAE
jgi:hypothetical protein